VSDSKINYDRNYRKDSNDHFEIDVMNIERLKNKVCDKPITF